MANDIRQYINAYAVDYDGDFRIFLNKNLDTRGIIINYNKLSLGPNKNNIYRGIHKFMEKKSVRLVVDIAELRTNAENNLANEIANR